MLKKSNKSAIVLSGIAFLSALATFLVWEIAQHSMTRTMATRIQTPAIGWQDVLVFVVAALGVMVVFVLPGAFLIHNWDESYFGVKGAIKWALFGIVLGCIARLRLSIPSFSPEKSVTAFAVESVISLGCGVIGIYIAHFLVFRLRKRGNW